MNAENDHAVAGEPTTADTKRALRSEMRTKRKSLVDRSARSEQLWNQLLGRREMLAARRVLIFDSITGEPETDQLRARLDESDVEVGVPEDDGLEPGWPDVIVVPGLAFTRDGRRLGQGGGWYDRFLSGCRDDCAMIGVCFDVQLLDDLPTEDHDVVLDVVVTESEIFVASNTRDTGVSDKADIGD